MSHPRNLQRFLQDTTTLRYQAVHFPRNQVNALFDSEPLCWCVAGASDDNTHSVQHAKLLFRLLSISTLELTDHFVDVLQGLYV